jgi:hypothetical protein
MLSNLVTSMESLDPDSFSTYGYDYETVIEDLFDAVAEYDSAVACFENFQGNLEQLWADYKMTSYTCDYFRSHGNRRDVVDYLNDDEIIIDGTNDMTVMESSEGFFHNIAEFFNLYCIWDKYCLFISSISEIFPHVSVEYYYSI